MKKNQFFKKAIMLLMKKFLLTKWQAIFAVVFLTLAGASYALYLAYDLPIQPTIIFLILGGGVTAIPEERSRYISLSCPSGCEDDCRTCPFSDKGETKNQGKKEEKVPLAFLMLSALTLFIAAIIFLSLSFEFNQYLVELRGLASFATLVALYLVARSYKNYKSYRAQLKEIKSA